jgi:hypothetical protein
MYFSPKRAVAATVLAIALVVGAGIAPAGAASATDVIVVKGHVKEPDGTPVKGVIAQSDCGCDGVTSTYALGRDRTSSTGYFSYKVERQYALNMGVNDSTEKYLFGARTAHGTIKTATGYTINVTMQKASVISGTISRSDGGARRFATAYFYRADTGKGAGSAFVNTAGKYVAHLKAGTFTVKFGGASSYVSTSWYGGTSKADATPVTVGYGKKVTGIDGVVTPKPTISGVIKIDGERPIGGVKERAVVTISDASGAQVNKRATDERFSFVKLKPGTYTVRVAPTKASGNYFTPVTQTVTLPAGTAIDRLVLATTSNPATTTNKRSVTMSLNPKGNSFAKTGKVFHTKISVKSYGSVTGAKVNIYVNGEKVSTRTLPASGRINWSKRMPTVTIGTFDIRVAYAGTSTTLARKSIVYALYGA